MSGRDRSLRWPRQTTVSSLPRKAMQSRLLIDLFVELIWSGFCAKPQGCYVTARTAERFCGYLGHRLNMLSAVQPSHHSEEIECQATVHYGSASKPQLDRTPPLHLVWTIDATSVSSKSADVNVFSTFITLLFLGLYVGILCLLASVTVPM